MMLELGFFILIYTIDNQTNFIKLFDNVPIVHKQGTQLKYYDVSCSFDIETSSYYIDNNNILTDDINNKKCVNMYVWQFAINDNIIYGRTWSDFIQFIKNIINKLNCNSNLLLPIYVHNLSYEFSFIYKLFIWDNVFAISERKPIYARTKNGLEFRCSYILSGYNLDTLAKNLENKNIKKLIGDLDYNLIRHAKTELTAKELDYCFNDVLIVTQYINEQRREFGNIAKIPLTQTGKVRRYVKKNCFINKAYKYFIKGLTLDVLEYQKLQLCYSGGFTHSNAIHTNDVCKDVSSYDFTSSYPYAMLSEMYPMGKGRRVQLNSIDMFYNLLKNYCCLFTIKISKVKPLTINENILQISKCYNVKKPIVNNGRIVECEELTTVVNEVDFYNINLFYQYENLEVSYMYVYEKDYLPKEIILSILELYNKKTILKGVNGKEKEYLNSKEKLNSVYGMCVTNTMKENIFFNGVEWVKDKNFNINTSIENYNTDRNRFLFYPWGVWVTSYARKNLFSGIVATGNDYIYSDTDSIKIMNKEKYNNYFNTYNNDVKDKLKNMCNHYNIDFNLCQPKTIKGVTKLLGVWDYEETYKEFKTLGAKRYIYKDNKDDYHITISGLSKKAIEYIKNESEKNKMDVMKFFSNYMYIPDKYTYKNTHTYIDNETMAIVTDYKGKTEKILCLSGVHLSPTDFTMSLGDMYINYLIKLQTMIY